MDHREIRVLIIKAIAQDALLSEQLVLKGGNALTLVYNVGQRSSLDLDFSIEENFSNASLASIRLQKALTTTFRQQNLYIFDYKFDERPEKSEDDWWGGYRAEFKVITYDMAESYHYEFSRMRRASITVGPGTDKRKFFIEISKFEYIASPHKHSVQSVPVKVYPPVLLAAEKLRAILQQHDKYPKISSNAKRSRARDFYDIWVIGDHFSIDLAAYLDVVIPVFEAKQVDPSLLQAIDDVRDLHEASWSDVELSVAQHLKPFDFYFEYVRDVADRLYAAWMENAP